MPNIAVEILVVLLLILANGVFAMAEIAMVSARKTRLEQRADDGERGAKVALALAEEPTRFLSTVQIGISLIGVLAGAVGGATLADELARLIARVSILAPYSQAIALALVVLVITYFSLVLGELIPKRVALGNPERIAVRVAPLMRFISRAAAPVVSLLTRSTELGLRLIGARPSDEPSVTESEVRQMMEEGTSLGVFMEAEQDMFEGILRLGERRVDGVMTPRIELVTLDLDDTPRAILETVLRSHHSFFPVTHGSIDNILGVLRAKELLAASLNGAPPADLKPLLQAAVFVPESMAALKALELFKANRVQVALVIDEYGGLQGMVTPYDILVAIVGEFPPEGAHADPSAIQREDGSWLFDGMIQVDELKELLDVGELPDEDRGSYQTLGGFVMSQMGSIPRAGEHFEWGGLRFEVVDMDGRRVDKVLVAPVKTQ